MVGIVLVSHSRQLALAAQSLVRGVTGTDAPIAIAAGTGDDRAELGTDAMEIMEAIQSVMSDEGVIVLMDMGSAILSAETALDFLDETQRAKVTLCPAPFVEGAVAASVTAQLDSPLALVVREAARALHQKQEHLQPQSAPPAEEPTSVTAKPPADAPSIIVKVRNPHGLHARPAVHLVKTAARFDADILVENVTHSQGVVSAKSLSSIVSLEVLQGHELRVTASGRQAQEALRAIRALVESGMGESLAPAAPAAVSQNPHQPQPVAEGIAIGHAAWLSDQPLAVPQDRSDDPDAELFKLNQAIQETQHALAQDQAAARASVGEQNAEIFAAQAMLLSDPVLLNRARQLIHQDKNNAALAWHTSASELAAHYQELHDPYLRQRATDIRDVGRRMLQALGVDTQAQWNGDADSILIADDFTPGDVIQLTRHAVAGVICLDGGTTSHSAILLRTAGIPSVVQARTQLAPLIAQRTRALVALDGSTGQIWLNPDEKQVTELKRQRERWLKEHNENLALARQPATTRDGHTVEITANVAQIADADAAIQSGAEGAGLLRTEFLFLHRDRAPTEDEQVALLEPIVSRLGQHPVVIRTLDAGGDKEISYLGLPKEANPFLGVRALRISLRDPELFRTQLRALLRVAHHRNVRIMFPMISQAAELREALAQLQTAHDELSRAGTPHAWPISTGIMIEIPSAVFAADELAKLCDFFSVGTNDLVQYLFAADRGNPNLSHLQDALHPAVLRALRQVISAAHRHGKHVSVCGEAASDVAAALIFMALGVDSLSMSAPAIPQVKSAIRNADFAALERIAAESLTLADAAAVRTSIAHAAGLRKT